MERSLLCLVGLLFGAALPLRAAPADSAGQPLAGMDTVNRFQEEPDSFWVSGPKGKIQVVIEPSARAARRTIQAERSKRFYGGRSVDLVQEEMAREPDTKPFTSVFIGLTKDAKLVGAFKPQTSDNPNPVQIWYFDLQGGANPTTKVTLSGGFVDGSQRALFVRLTNATGREQHWLILTADNTVSAGWGDTTDR